MSALRGQLPHEARRRTAHEAREHVRAHVRELRLPEVVGPADRRPLEPRLDRRRVVEEQPRRAAIDRLPALRLHLELERPELEEGDEPIAARDRSLGMPPPTAPVGR